MANQFGIDLGQVYQTAEAIKGSRQKRRMNEFELDTAKADREAARQRASTMNALNERIAAGGEGSEEALRQRIAISPDEGKKIQDAFAQMDENQRKQTQDNLETVGQVGAYVLNAESEEEQRRRYQYARENLSEEVTARMPEEYDPNFVQMSLARTREIEDLIASSQPGDIDVQTFGGDDVMTQDGQVVDRTESNSLRRTRLNNQPDPDDGRLESADTNAIYRQSAGLFGGSIDPQTGRIAGVNADTSQKIQAVANEASRIYNNGEATTHAEAVTLAGRRLGLEIENLNGRGGGNGGDNGGGNTGGTMDRNELLDMYLNN